MQQEYDIAVTWEPFELHPEIPVEGLVLNTYQQRNFDGMVARLTRLAAEQDIPMVFSEVIPNSRHALEASEYARDLGKHEAFHQTVFHKFYGLGEDLRGWDLLRDAAAEIGLDPDALQHATEAGTYQERVRKKILGAYQRGVTSVPAYVFNDQYAIFGAQPYPVFKDLMTRILNDSLDSAEMGE